MSQRKKFLYFRLLMFALGYSEQYEEPVPLIRGSYAPYCWCLFAHLKKILLTCYFNLYLLHCIIFLADYFIYFRIVLVHEEENVQCITIDAYLMIKTLKNSVYDDFVCVCVWGMHLPHCSVSLCLPNCMRKGPLCLFLCGLAQLACKLPSMILWSQFHEFSCWGTLAWQTLA